MSRRPGRRQAPPGAKPARDPGALEAVVSHRFADSDLLVEALTHGSRAEGRSYERLEFLGDRVLGLIVAKLLLQTFPDEPEGALGKRHAMLVRKESIAGVAREISLGEFVRMAPDHAARGGLENDSILSDVGEAVIGALFLDGGLPAAEAFVERHWRPLLEAQRQPPRDAKSALQEWAMERGRPLPTYREVARSGADHAPLFTIAVAVEGHASEEAQGPSKKAAEHAAADKLLRRLTEQQA